MTDLKMSKYIKKAQRILDLQNTTYNKIQEYLTISKIYHCNIMNSFIYKKNTCVFKCVFKCVSL